MNPIIIAILIHLGAYITFQGGRILLAIMKMPMNYCPFCIATIITWITGFIFVYTDEWPIAIPMIYLGISIFDMATRIKAHLTSKGNKYADYIRQIIAFTATSLALIILLLIKAI